MTNLLQIKKESEVATITLNRPDKRNSLLPETLDALDSYLDDVVSDKSIRILVITGAGEKAFCTGADLHVFSEHTPEEVRTKWVRRGHEIFRKLFEVPQVTIAKLNGDTLGGGLELALACDLRIASNEAKLGFPENRVGTTPGWNGFQRAVEIIGISRTRELILTGNPISAAKAESWGLINYISAPVDLDSATDQLILEIVKSAPIAQKVSKQILNTFQNTHANMLMESLAGAYAHQSKDFQEGVSAFKEKRQPKFKGE
jgi:enoyl-CoA hydratase/carnithine racemase